MHFFYIILPEDSFEDFLRILSLQNSYILSLCFGKSVHHRNEVTKLQPHDTKNPDLSKDLSRREMQNSHCLLGLVSMGFPAKWSFFLFHLPSLFPRTVSLTMKPPLQMWSHLVTKKSMWSHLDRLLSKISFFFWLENSSSSNDLFIVIVPVLLCSWFPFMIMIHCCLISRKLFIF